MLNQPPTPTGKWKCPNCGEVNADKLQWSKRRNRWICPNYGCESNVYRQKSFGAYVLDTGNEATK